jgi:hypothetical protein
MFAVTSVAFTCSIDNFGFDVFVTLFREDELVPSELDILLLLLSLCLVLLLMMLAPPWLSGTIGI